MGIRTNNLQDMAFKLTQITDTHLTQEHPSRTADLEKCLAAIKAEPTPPDLIIHSGDVTHNALPQEYAMARELFQTLDCPVLAVPGNRDRRQPFVECFAADGYLDTDNPYIQYEIEHGGYRLLFLDTLCEESNKGELCDARLLQLSSMLQKDSVKPVVIIMHHAPFEAHEIPDPKQFVDWNDVAKLSALLKKHPQVERIICGHVHRTIASSVAHIPADALTCLAGDLRKGQVEDSERQLPVFRHFLLGETEV